jgi:mitochondrial transcription factor 1
VALWSAKLHSRLKPRTHLLLEPEDKFYGPCLKPLLEAPDSKYRLVPKSGLVWGHLESALSEHLPLQQSYKTDDPRLEEENNTLLVIANIGYHPAKAYAGFASLSMLVLNQFMSAMRSHTLFERYGLVRVLVWTGDAERRVLLPVQIHSRRKTALETEFSCSIREIASSTEPARYRREKSQDVATARTVLEKMQEAGIKTPPGRESILLSYIAEQDEANNKKRSASIGDSITRNGRKLAQFEADYAAGKFSKYNVDPDVDTSEFLDDPNLYTPEYLYLTKLRSNYKRNISMDENAHHRIREVLDLMELERKIFRAKEEGEDVEADENQLKESYQSWRDHILYGLSDTDQRSVLYILDNKLAFESEPPLLLWDRRDIEPLRVESNEFYPSKPMCLLDMQPRSLKPGLRKGRGTQDVLEFLLGNLYIQPAQSMKKGLASLWPGAYEWLVAECPSLTNPLKGGCIDLEMIRVRCMTIEMVEEMVEAWDRWPFKPTKYELVSRMGASGHEVADYEED